MKVLTVDEAASFLRISRSQIYVLLKAGELKSIKISGSRRLLESQLIDFIKNLEEITND